MLQVNHYRKVCYLTDSDMTKITDFFKDMFEVDQIVSISLYLDENNDRVCEIDGFDKPISKVVGSYLRNDMPKREPNVIYNAEDFKAFADKYNKQRKAKEILEGINELTKEAGKLGLRLQ